MAEATTVGDSLESLQAWLPSAGDWFRAWFDNLTSGNWLDLTWGQFFFTPIALYLLWFILAMFWSWVNRPSDEVSEAGDTIRYLAILFATALIALWLYT